MFDFYHSYGFPMYSFQILDLFLVFVIIGFFNVQVSNFRQFFDVSHFKVFQHIIFKFQVSFFYFFLLGLSNFRFFGFCHSRAFQGIVFKFQIDFSVIIILGFFHL